MEGGGGCGWRPGACRRLGLGSQPAGAHAARSRRPPPLPARAPPVCVFSMQGWGNLFNTMVLVILMAAFGQYGKPYDPDSLSLVWRLSYGARRRRVQQRAGRQQR